MATVYRCFLTNNSRYDLKIKVKDARQFGLFTGEKVRNWDIDLPDLIKAGQKADPNRATFEASAPGIDGVKVYVDYDVMEGEQSRGVIGIRGTVYHNFARTADVAVYFDGGNRASGLLKLLNVERYNHPNGRTGHTNHHVTLTNK